MSNVMLNSSSSRSCSPPGPPKTKIVCTLGPSSWSRNVLKEMIEAGMDVVRLNFSHGEQHEMEEIFKLVRELSQENDNQVSILCDIQGPKIRTGRMEAKFTLHAGQHVKVTPERILGNAERFTITYAGLLTDLDAGDAIFVNDGIVKLVVIERVGGDLLCVVESGGDISDHKGCNIPSGRLSIEVPTPKDREDLKLIARLDPEFVAASFIGSAADVIKVKECLAEFGNPNIKVISKIERPVALANLDAIISESYGIMVARGDLGVEIPPWKVPTAQKRMVLMCNRVGKPVIVATQMLESMTVNARPTRAELSDVYNAVLDGADAVMLSGETSVGAYAVESVKMMNTIVEEAETQMPRREPSYFDAHTELPAGENYMQAIGHAVFSVESTLQRSASASKVITLARSGVTSRMICKYRPNIPILAFTQSLRTCRELNLSWGVRSTYLEEILPQNGLEGEMIQIVRQAIQKGLVDCTDRCICVGSSSLLHHGAVFMSVLSAETVSSDAGFGVCPESPA